MAIDLYQELRRLVDELARREIDYALAGALALAVHGVVRATADIDLLVLPADVDEALTAARGVGFGHEALPKRFSDGTQMRRITRIEEDDALTLDLLLVDQTLEPVWRSRSTIDTEEGPLRVISREALIQMKTLSGREQDLADIRRLNELDR